MHIRTVALAGFMAAAAIARGQAQPPRHHPHPSHPLGAPGAGVHQAAAPMAVDTWFALAPQETFQKPPPPPGQLDTSPAKDGTEYVTVYGHRKNPDAEWRGDLLAAQPVYEARNSVSAQPLYGGQAVWDSPEEEHVMSSAKDALGLCGALGGWVTCPDK